MSAYIAAKRGRERREAQYNTAHRLKNMNTDTFFKSNAQKAESTQEQRNAINDGVSPNEANQIFKINKKTFDKIDTDQSGILSQIEIKNEYVKRIVQKQMQLIKGPLDLKAKNSLLKQELTTYIDDDRENSFNKKVFFLGNNQIILDVSTSCWPSSWGNQTFSLVTRNDKGESKYSFTMSIDSTGYPSIETHSDKVDMKAWLSQIINDKNVDGESKLLAIKMNALLK